MLGVPDIAQRKRRHLLYLLLVWRCPLPAGSERKNSWAKMMEAHKGERVITTGHIRCVTAVIGDVGPGLDILIELQGSVSRRTVTHFRVT